MQNRAKVTATGLIWCVVLLLLRSAYWSTTAGGLEISGSSLMALVLILGAVATISINVVWRIDHSKSRERLLRTVGTLSDEEAIAMLDDLKARLDGSDREISVTEIHHHN